eukprot:c10292_g1_i1 orf=550-852(-)
MQINLPYIHINGIVSRNSHPAVRLSCLNKLTTCTSTAMDPSTESSSAVRRSCVCELATLTSTSIDTSVKFTSGCETEQCMQINYPYIHANGHINKNFIRM